jgi:hypothetical protein
MLQPWFCISRGSFVGTRTQAFRAPRFCVDEFVQVSGILHVVRHTTQTPNAASHVYSAFFTAVNAVGLLSGDCERRRHPEVARVQARV